MKNKKYSIRNKPKRSGGTTTSRPGTRSKKTSKTILKTSKISKISKTILPVFKSSEGEHDLEANLAFLIEIMGGSIYDDYIEYILNKDLNNKIQLINKDENPNEVIFNNGPRIFYGNKSTHFICTLGDKRTWDPYKSVQKKPSDHFCQTFTLMYMENHFNPTSYIGKQFNELKTNNDDIDIPYNIINNKPISKHNKELIISEYYYLKNVLIAIDVACYVIKSVIKIIDINNTDYVNIALINKGKKQHELYNNDLENDPEKLLKKLINYCESLTEEQILNSSFIQKIFLI